ncbi:hypothetical protein [Oenococcus sicerae]|uniref:hypothetical protein n=1 Tax=Oenococcus sicerae TaxID=2203724 RepID=UPI0026590A01|nr:hypothetical protein [Oenococcus sicerae]
MAKKTGLSFDELKLMDVGSVMDYITEYANQETKNTEDNSEAPKEREATQADIDAVFG